MAVEIPLIDLPFDAPREELAKQLLAAVSSVGFLHVKLEALGLTGAEVKEMFAIHKELYDSPIEERQACPLDEHRNGFKGVGATQLAETAKKGDLRESFVVGHYMPPRTFEDQPLPPALAKHKAKIASWHQKTNKAMNVLLEAVAVALNLPSQFFVEKHTPGMNSVSFINYPPVPAEDVDPEAIRAGAHKDWGSITLLFQEDDGVPGLEVLLPEAKAQVGEIILAKDSQDAKGTWAMAPIVPGTVLVNVGLALEAWTQGYLRATLHRVTQPPALPDGSLPGRRSMTLFSQPRHEVVFDPISKTGEIMKTGKSITSRQFFLDRMAASAVKAY